MEHDKLTTEESIQAAEKLNQGEDANGGESGPSTFRQKYFPTVDEKKKWRAEKMRKEHPASPPAYSESAPHSYGPPRAGGCVYGPDPVTTFCPYCQVDVVTRTTDSPNALCCFLFGICSLCYPGCQDVEHKCPNCNHLLGNYKAT